jgi:hypothetical protein
MVAFFYCDDYIKHTDVINLPRICLGKEQAYDFCGAICVMLCAKRGSGDWSLVRYDAWIHDI